MRKLFAIVLLLTILNASSFSQNVGIGTNTPHPSAALEIKDSSKGMLIPRMTMNQRNAIQNPAEGLMVYQTDSTKGYWYFDGEIWRLNGLTKNARRGEMLYWNGNNWVSVTPGANGQTLTYCNGVPTWGPCPPSSPLINDESLVKAFYGYASGYTIGSYPTVNFFMVKYNGYLIEFTDTLGNFIGSGSSGPGFGSYVGGRFSLYPSFAKLTPRKIIVSANITDTATGNSNPLEIYENGFCWNTTPNPTVDNNVIYSSYGAGNISADFSELTEDQTYYLRPFCNTNIGYFYGNAITYTHKKITEPNIISIPTNIISNNSIKFGGEISGNYECVISERGVCWSTSPNPTINNYKTTDAIGYDGWNYPNLSGSYQHELTNLTPGTTYYIRAISTPFYTNRFNTKYGQEFVLTTLSQ